MMLGVVVAQVDEELILACEITYPLKGHVNRFRLFLFDSFVGEAVGGRVVYLDWIGRLWVP